MIRASRARQLVSKLLLVNERARREGRLTARPGQTLSWDLLGRLTEVRNSSTNALIAAYAYDALDRLRTADNGTLRTRLRYTGLTTAVAQTVNDATGAVIRSIAVDWAGQRLIDWTGAQPNRPSMCVRRTQAP